MRNRCNSAMRFVMIVMMLCGLLSCRQSKDTDILEAFPEVTSAELPAYFPLVGSQGAAGIYVDERDYRVVRLAAASRRIRPTTSSAV